MQTLKEIYQEELTWFLNNNYFNSKNSSLKDIQYSAIYYANKRYQDQFKGIKL